MTASPALEIQMWPIDRLILYARNHGKNDAALDRICSSIREFGSQIPVLASSGDEVVNGHFAFEGRAEAGHYGNPGRSLRRMNSAASPGFPAAGESISNLRDFDEEPLALELQDLSAPDFDLCLTRFDDLASHLIGQ